VSEGENAGRLLAKVRSLLRSIFRSFVPSRNFAHERTSKKSASHFSTNLHFRTVRLLCFTLHFSLSTHCECIKISIVGRAASCKFVTRNRSVVERMRRDSLVGRRVCEPG